MRWRLPGGAAHDAGRGSDGLLRCDEACAGRAETGVRQVVDVRGERWQRAMLKRIVERFWRMRLDAGDF